MPRSTSRGGTGRIHPHQRDADFDGTLIGNGINLSKETVSGVHSTEQFTVEESTKRTHQNAIKHIYSYWEVHFPDYYAVGVCSLSKEEILDQTKYFWKNKKDLVYRGFNTKFLKAFLSAKMKKENGKLMLFKTIRKYWDAVQYGAREEDTLLLVSFSQEKDKFLTAFKNA